MQHRSRLRGIARLLLVVGATSLTACADDGPDAARAAATEVAPPEEVTVRIERSRFGRRELTVSVGTTIRFVNDDAFAHTVTAVDGAPLAFDSGELAERDAFEITLDEPGEYVYSCRIHPTMRATVIVA